ncbi:hypothetical protein SAMN04515671_3798 [Nakamurella panacisegetis]|uniref:Uncharacterized protein n=1 Tax=Nakamurella panacisegetis TaxID=1090615 RepID=A0A1H0RY00_9ACTN|nr:hypothetical protein SAMN04515671_3798 [Nakamurella panacisegetis]
MTHQDRPGDDSDEVTGAWRQRRLIVGPCKCSVTHDALLGSRCCQRSRVLVSIPDCDVECAHQLRQAGPSLRCSRISSKHIRNRGLGSPGESADIVAPGRALGSRSQLGHSGSTGRGAENVTDLRCSCDRVKVGGGRGVAASESGQLRYFRGHVLGRSVCCDGGRSLEIRPDSPVGKRSRRVECLPGPRVLRGLRLELGKQALRAVGRKADHRSQLVHRQVEVAAVR